MVTRKDIAERLGVSVSVVSRALNNSGYVDAKKKELILKTAEEMGYCRDQGTNPVTAHCPDNFVFCCRDIENAFNMEMYAGVLDAAYENGYTAVFSQYFSRADLRDSMMKGVILPNEAEARRYLDVQGKNNYLPAVTASFASSVQTSRHIHRVRADLWHGMEMMLDHLYACGHRRIAMAAYTEIERCDGRVMAWKAFMHPLLGSSLMDYYICVTDDMLRHAKDHNWCEIGEPGEYTLVRRPELRVEPYFDKGRIAAQMIHRRGLDATAVICFNDEMALGFYKELRRLGYSIPQDVSVAGIDGSIVRRYFDQQLTTLDIHPYRIGRKCAETLIEIIRGEKPRSIVDMPMDIVEGDTVRRIR